MLKHIRVRNTPHESTLTLEERIKDTWVPITKLSPVSDKQWTDSDGTGFNNLNQALTFHIQEQEIPL